MPPKASSPKKKPKVKKPPRVDKDGKRIKKKKRVETFSTYIYKVLKQVHPDTGITRRSMSIMNSVVMDLLGKIIPEAGALTARNRKRTLTSRDVQSATRFILPGELTKHAVSEGTKAVVKFTSSKS